MRYRRWVAQRWVRRYEFHWAPLISFRQRRDEFAHWVDDNESPRAILDEDEVVGVAVGHRNLRLTMHRTGFDISVGSPRIDIDPLERVVPAIARIFRSRGVHVASGRTVHTYEIDADYDLLRRRLGRRVTGGQVGEGFEEIDCSALVDFSQKDRRLQVEFGVVRAEELEERLRSPGRGRLRGLDLPRVSDVGEGFPSVSLLCDATWRALRSYPAADDDYTMLWNYITDSIRRIDADSALVADELGRSTEQEVRDEFGRGA